MGTKLLATAPAVMIMCVMLVAVAAQEREDNTPTVPLVKSVGCVEKDGDAWFLTRATEPEVTEYPFPSAAELEDAGSAAPGSSRLQLIGVTDFLDVNGLLASFDRAEHTARESANATGAIAEGRKLAVKGLYITSVEPHRVNLTSAMALADTCN
ncbi:MAG: hypothetical protein F4Y57_11305 [Acidobacteria bacterium]|nr:hypothetical protein [Acidobacteriota bacterium]